MVDSVYRTRSLGVAAAGLPDQYADGKAAKVWEAYIGNRQERTQQYKQWLCTMLNKYGCENVLDVACGNGVDSVMLVEAGFNVTSSDASDKMLKYALRQRWNRRNEAAFDKWVIEEANWLTLPDDLEGVESRPAEGYDAVLCLGNSFAHMPDSDGDQSGQKQAIENFISMLRPGGVLLIDHRNYDEILDSGAVPAKNVYYNSSDILRIKCSNLYVDGKATLTTMDYYMDVQSMITSSNIKLKTSDMEHHFRLSYYPHRLNDFNNLLMSAAGENAGQHLVFADFKDLDAVDKPAYFIHLLQKAY